MVDVIDNLLVIVYSSHSYLDIHLCMTLKISSECLFMYSHIVCMFTTCIPVRGLVNKYPKPVWQHGKQLDQS